MGLFNNKKQSYRPEPSVAYEPLMPSADQLRQSAIEYIVSLPKSDKDRFFEAVDLIWQGYSKLDRVKTLDERQSEREAKANGGVAPISDDELDDELAMAFLDDEPITPNPAVTTVTLPPAPEAKRVEVK